jgi:hypothetical protein
VTALRDPDTEKAVVLWLKAWMGPYVYVVAEGEQLTNHPVPAILVGRVGGSGYTVEADHLLEVTVIAPDRPTLWPTCSEVLAGMLEIVGNGFAMVDDVELAGHFAPPETNPNPDNRRATALFRLTARPQ